MVEKAEWKVRTPGALDDAGVSPFAASAGRIVVVGRSRVAGVVAQQLLAGLPVVLSDRVDPDVLGRTACLILCDSSAGDIADAIRVAASVSYARGRILVVADDSNAMLRVMSEKRLMGQLIPLPRVREVLRERVLQIARPHFLDRAVMDLERADLPDPVLQFVWCAWATAVPPGSVTRATRLVDTSETTLRELWTEAGLRPHLKEVLDWGTLGRAVTHRESGMQWYTVAQRLRTNQRRLRRIALRLLGSSLREVDAAGPAVVADRFQLWYARSFGPPRAV